MITIRKAVMTDIIGEPELLAKGVAAGAWIAEDEIGPVCIWGLHAEYLMADEAFVWMHTWGRLPTYSLRFLRASRRFIEDALARYSRLVGTVDPDYVVSCRWLSWLGFQFAREFTVGTKVYHELELSNGH